MRSPNTDPPSWCGQKDRELKGVVNELEGETGWPLFWGCCGDGREGGWHGPERWADRPVAVDAKPRRMT